MSDLRLNRRQLLAAGAGLALTAYGASGCTVERPLDTSAAGDIVEPKIDGDLLIFNWAQYMDPAIKKEFGEKYGVEVNEVNFDNLEAMMVKLRSGGEYDLIFPSSEYVGRLRKEQLIRPFDRSQVKNAATVSPYFDGPWYDPNSEFSLPYTYYTTGIAWRTDKVDTMTESWNDMSNPEAFGKIFMLDDFQEGIGQANLLNGFYLNTAKPEELEVSKETLLEQKKGLRGFSTLTAQNLVSGSAWIQQAWNGDVVNARNQVSDPSIFRYQTCKEGVPVGTDAMSIPVTAKSPGTALLFIDWVLSPKNAYRNVMWNGYPQPVAGGREAFAKLVKDDPSIDVNLNELKGSSNEFRLDTPEARREWNRIWTEVKA
ncbi:MAG: spermidine/putrescine ABC transporter substrate-binding protein [Solirubrobacterales bacterium]|nr:spermidine/putrescine ABC transporter substrate-binding protein [Solirubrobacterales bacterium]